jgi:Avidin family
LSRLNDDLELYSSPVAIALNLAGVWINDRGSCLKLGSPIDGRVKGNYYSSLSQQDEPIRGQLIGMIAGDVFGFVISWRPTFNSVTSWSAQVIATERGRCLRAVWCVPKRINADADSQDLFMSGVDRFWRQQTGHEA